MISAIRWVSELIGVAGGDDVFAELGRQPMGRDRVIADPAGAGATCARPDRSAPGAARSSGPSSVAARAGWQDVPAVRQGRLHEIKSCDILQPGPAALTDGLAQLHRLIAAAL